MANGGLGLALLGNMVANGGLSEPTQSLRESKGRQRNLRERERETWGIELREKLLI